MTLHCPTVSAIKSKLIGALVNDSVNITGLSLNEGNVIVEEILSFY